jgi:hypothetical protein
MEPAVLENHGRELAVLGNLWREVTFQASCGTDMDCKIFTEKWRKPPLVTQVLHQKRDLCQQAAASSCGKPTQETSSSSQPGAAEKSKRDRDSPQRETYLSRSPPREPAVLAYHHKELAAVQANLWREPDVLAHHHRDLVILANLRKAET